MSLAIKLLDLATRIATELKAHKTLINGNAGDLSALHTSAKSNLVAALNEVKDALGTAGAAIDDAAVAAGTTWSSSKITTQINASITALINGAPSASDTLKELADQITALAQADAGLLSFAQPQTLSSQQKTQGCANLGIGEPETDFVATFNAGLA